MTLDQALAMSWERLELLTTAHERRQARLVLQLMIAAQGDGDCWKRQAEQLRKILK